MSAFLRLACMCALACVRGAPAVSDAPDPCVDAVGAAEKALTKINQDRQQGYIFSLHHLSNYNQAPHPKGSAGVIYFLVMDVLETKCHVLSREDWQSCEVRQTHETPVYGQCKAFVSISQEQKDVRLYSYRCRMRPAPASKIGRLCPDCPSRIDMDSEEVLKAAKLSLEKYNMESGQPNYFALLNITRASAQGGFGMFYFAEFTIQETVCANSTDISQAPNCTLMDCEFAHKGLCKGSHSVARGREYITVSCKIFEPEAAEKEKERHLLGGEHGHGHNHSHTPPAPPKRPLGTVVYLPARQQQASLPPLPDSPPPFPSFTEEGLEEPPVTLLPLRFPPKECSVAHSHSTFIQELFDEDLDFNQHILN
ncbi:hypothetical protein JZ751_015375, partial [Albula glossodonta]